MISVFLELEGPEKAIDIVRRELREAPDIEHVQPVAEISRINDMSESVCTCSFLLVIKG